MNIQSSSDNNTTEAKPSRITTEENPLVVVYSSTCKNNPHLTGMLNLTVAMNIHSIPAKFQKELTNMVLSSGVEVKELISEDALANWNANNVAEGLEPGFIWFELSKHHAIEIAENKLALIE